MVDSGKALNLKRITGDEYEGALCGADPGVGTVPRQAKRVSIDVGSFLQSAEDVITASKGTGDAAKQARRLSQQLTISMDAFNAVATSAGKGGGGRADARNRYVMAFIRWIRKGEVEKITARLQSSPSYHALLKEQAEKRQQEKAKKKASAS